MAERIANIVFILLNIYVILIKIYKEDPTNYQINEILHFNLKLYNFIFQIGVLSLWRMNMLIQRTYCNLMLTNYNISGFVNIK